jgi:hypothetical protein
MQQANLSVIGSEQLLEPISITVVMKIPIGAATPDKICLVTTPS